MNTLLKTILMALCLNMGSIGITAAAGNVSPLDYLDYSGSTSNSTPNREPSGTDWRESLAEAARKESRAIDADPNSFKSRMNKFEEVCGDVGADDPAFTTCAIWGLRLQVEDLQMTVLLHSMLTGKSRQLYPNTGGTNNAK